MLAFCFHDPIDHFRFNLTPLCSFYQDMAPHLEKGSSVIFITSIAGFQPQGAMAMYGVTKTALLGLTKVCVSLSPSHD